jgi:hypothetical protein
LTNLSHQVLLKKRWVPTQVLPAFFGPFASGSSLGDPRDPCTDFGTGSTGSTPKRRKRQALKRRKLYTDMMAKIRTLQASDTPNLALKRMDFEFCYRWKRPYADMMALKVSLKQYLDHPNAKQLTHSKIDQERCVDLGMHQNDHRRPEICTI